MWLYGILSLPEQTSSRGVLIVVGGPQYRVGSHRQFALLARKLAAEGVPVLRFDYRGMGDSEGDIRSFENVEDDIRAAIDQLVIGAPAVKEVVIFGLCDAACAALFYANQDLRVRGLVLVNPWVRTSDSIAKVYLQHYYLTRLLDRELWNKIRQRRFAYIAAARSFFSLLGSSLRGWAKNLMHAAHIDRNKSSDGLLLPDRMFEGLERFTGRTLFIFSGNDLTAREFLNLVEGSSKWQRQLNSPRVEQRHLPDANHTFSRNDWRTQVGTWTSEWIKS
jgi:exosortase A-associated hydrolase 1